MAAGEVRAGRAFVEFFANDKELQKGMKRVQARLNAFGRGLGLIGAAITAPLGAALTRFASVGDALDKMSHRTGVAVESLSELKFAAEQTGASADILEKGFAGLSRTFFDAQRGSSKAVESLERLGLTIHDLEGLSPDQQFARIAEGLSQLSDESVRGAVAQEIFGRAGRQLLPLLKSGSAGIEELREQARDLGLQMSTKDAAAAAKLTDAWNILKRSMESVALAIGSALAPAMTGASERIASIGGVIAEFIKRNREAVVAVGALGLAASAVSITTLTLSKVLGGLTKAILAVRSAVIFLSTHPLVALLTLLAALALAAAHATGALDPLYRWISRLVGVTGDAADGVSDLNTELDDLSGIAADAEAAIGGFGNSVDKQTEKVKAFLENTRKLKELERLRGQGIVFTDDREAKLKAEQEAIKQAIPDVERLARNMSFAEALPRPGIIQDFFRQLRLDTVKMSLQDVRDEFGKLLGDLTSSRTAGTLSRIGGAIQEALVPDLPVDARGTNLSAIAATVGGAGPAGALVGGMTAEFAAMADTINRSMEHMRNEVASRGTFNPFAAANIMRVGPDSNERQMQRNIELTVEELREIRTILRTSGKLVFS